MLGVLEFSDFLKGLRFWQWVLGVTQREGDLNCTNPLVDQESHCRGTADSRIPDFNWLVVDLPL